MPKILIVPDGWAGTEGRRVEVVDLGGERGHVLLCDLHRDDACPDIEPGDTWGELDNAVRYAVDHVRAFEGRQR